MKLITALFVVASLSVVAGESNIIDPQCFGYLKSFSFLYIISSILFAAEAGGDMMEMEDNGVSIDRCWYIIPLITYLLQL